MTIPAPQPHAQQPKESHRIYLAGSWKNQSEILLIRDILKSQGHEVDCFASEDNGRISFCWAKLDDIQDKLPSMDAKDMLEVKRVQEAFSEDKKWLDWCNLVLLILPSGKSAHLEAGYAKGQGKTVVIFGDLQKGDFDVMYGFADGIFRSDEIDLMVNFVNDTRSRPHPAPADKRVPYVECNHSYSSCPINWDAHNKTIARQAREKLLTDLFLQRFLGGGCYVKPPTSGDM